MPGMRVVEAGWLLLDKPESPMHVSALLVFKPSRSYDVLHHWRKHFASFRPTPPFNYIYRKSLTHPWGSWEPGDTYSFDDHVRGLALTPGENGPEDLHQKAAWLHSLPLERDRPLWQVFVIEGLLEGHYAILIKIHHALADGVFAMGLLDYILSPSPDELCEIPFWARKMRASRSSMQPGSWSKSIRNFLPAALGFGHGVLSSLPHAAAMKWPYQASPSILNQDITPRRHLEVSRFPLSALMEWGHQHNASLNDILLFLTGTALHQYLGQHSKKEPESLHALIPVSLRSQTESDHGCRLGFAVADLGQRDESPKERLDHVKGSTQAAKSFLQNFNAKQKQVLTSVLDILYVGSQIIPGLSKRLPPVAHLLVSNVMGPKETLYFNGDRLEQIIPLSLLANGQSLNVTALSYADQLFVSCVSCSDVVTDPGHLKNLFEAAFTQHSIN